MARGARTQRAFADLLGVEKSCLSRYESGKLGAPVVVINQCLALVADACDTHGTTRDVVEALRHAKLTVSCLVGDTSANSEK